MKHRLPLLGLFVGLLNPLFAQAQKSILLSQPPATVCVGTDLVLPFVTSLAVQPGTTFKIQFRRPHDSGSGVREFAATVDGTTLRGRMPDPRTLGLTVYGTDDSFELRVLSAAPEGESDWVSVRLGYPAQIRGLRATQQLVNPDQTTFLEVLGSGSTPLTLTFTDSSRFEINRSGYSNFDWTHYLSVLPERTRTYTVASVRNVCGLGTGSGSAEVKTNPFSVVVTNVWPQNVCAGGTLSVAYSTLGGTFSSTTRFGLQLVPTQTGTPAPVTITLNATESNGVVTATVPTTAVLDAGREYRVELVTSQPELVGSMGSRTVRLWNAPGAELVTASFTVDFNTSVSPAVQFRGVGPFTATLSDGTLVSSNQLVPSSSGTYAQVGSPARTNTNFQITSYTTGCSGGSRTDGKNTTQMQVRPGIIFTPSFPVNRQFCEGQPVSGPFLTNLPTVPSNTYQAVFQQWRNGQQRQWRVDAQVTGNTLSFTVPAISSGVPNPGSYDFWIESPSFSTRSSQTYLYVLGKPDAVLQGNTLNIHLTPKTVSMTLSLTGGGSHTVWLADSTSYLLGDYQQAQLSFPIFEPTTYHFVRVANRCFQSSINQQVGFSVPAPTTPTLSIRVQKPLYCAADSVAVTYKAFGTYLGANQFRLQVRRNYGEWTTVATNTATSGTFRFRADVGEYQARIASSDPIYTSAEQSFKVMDKPTAQLSAPFSATVLAGGFVTVVLDPKGGHPYEAILTDGVQDYFVPDASYSHYFMPLASGMYRIKSISNSCGVGTATGSARISVYQLRLSITGDVPTQICQGGTFAVPLQVEGRPTPSTRYRLQLINPTDTSRVVATLGESVGLVVQANVPTSVPPGTYSLRVVSIDPVATSEYTRMITIGAPPTATLTASDGSSSAVLAPSGSLRLTLTGSPPYRVLFQDNVEQSFAENSGTRFIEPVRGQTYSLKRVLNACGYGTVSGQVQVRIQPTLRASRTTTTFINPCAGQTLPVQLDARGDFEAGNLFRFHLFDSRNRLVARLDSGASGQRTAVLTLPSTLSAGTYQLRVSSTRPVLTQTISFALSSPPVVLLTGSATINPGQTAQLRLVQQAALPGYSTLVYQLSGGLSGSWEAFGTNATRDLPVSPTTTTTYTIQSVRNECGVGQMNGSVTVTVNPPADRTVNVLQSAFDPRLFCPGDTVRVAFEARGTFSGTNRFTVQLSDSTGVNFRDLTTVGPSSPLRALVPTSTPRGSGYRLRVAASDVGTQSGDSPYAFVLRQKATVFFDTANYIYEPGKPLKVVVRLTGDGPWAYAYRTDAGSFNRFSVQRTPDTLTLQPVAPTLFYQLSAVQNSCGAGTVGTPSRIKVELLTPTEPTPGTQARVFPNPTTSRVRIEWATTGPFRWTLTDSQGRVLAKFRGDGPATEIDVSAQPAGTYLLRLERAGTPAVYRIVRQ